MICIRELDRQEIDPEGRYQVEGLTQVERQALRVIPLLGGGYLMERTKDLFQFRAVFPEKPDVIVTPEFLELSLTRFEWPHPNIPERSSRFWRRVEWEEIDDQEVLRLLEQARKKRLAQYKKCRFCRSSKPEEFLTAGACDGCVAGHLGIVH